VEEEVQSLEEVTLRLRRLSGAGASQA
jgi:hypothetical protein